MRQALKRLYLRLAGKEEDAVVVSFLSGGQETARAMLAQVVELLPGRRHFAVTLDATAFSDIDGVTLLRLEPASALGLAHQVRRALRRYRIGMAPVLFSAEPAYAALRRAAFLVAPSKLLAYNQRLERHHLQFTTPVASALFLGGLPLDRIWLRPRWLWPWRRERTEYPTTPKVLEGRPLSPTRPRVAVVSPYFPYPLSHGGAVRIFNLLREASQHFDIFLFAFHEPDQLEETHPVMQFCARAVLFPMPRYREPRWSSWDPPEVGEFDVPALHDWLERTRREHHIHLVQLEYSYLAGYQGHVLVAHDVTFDLCRQAHARQHTLSSRWNWYRWRRFETAAIRRFHAVVTMSEKDARLLETEKAIVVPNGVDLERFRPTTERAGKHLLFIGSFRHLPNIVAYRFFVEEVWPALIARDPEITLTVVAGPDPGLYWRTSGQPGELASHPGIRLLGFVRDVRPLYEEANLVIVPTLESAGTNLKVIEALAMQRAVVSTHTGCAGLGLRHGKTVWLAPTAGKFVEGILALLGDPSRRQGIARAARAYAEEHYGWAALGDRQRALWQALLDRRHRP